ncbi:hypothetical protein BJ508DRAFT_306048 [Ascobolus immersus RN42]|uniref:Uncharacterized protein n=1 Tax=Ascobolus immersus RN42 TaxID=1160509 RepID=A0A3N4I739_ASCIM|nr:hypothetical protein BJ508DRAFT_306048 [Ascobolus immersus RN42]
MAKEMPPGRVGRNQHPNLDTDRGEGLVEEPAVNTLHNSPEEHSTFGKYRITQPSREIIYSEHQNTSQRGMRGRSSQSQPIGQPASTRNSFPPSQSRVLGHHPQRVLTYDEEGYSQGHQGVESDIDDEDVDPTFVPPPPKEHRVPQQDHKRTKMSHEAYTTGYHHMQEQHNAHHDPYRYYHHYSQDSHGPPHPMSYTHHLHPQQQPYGDYSHMGNAPHPNPFMSGYPPPQYPPPGRGQLLAQHQHSPVPPGPSGSSGRTGAQAGHPQRPTANIGQKRKPSEVHPGELTIQGLFPEAGDMKLVRDYTAEEAARMCQRFIRKLPVNLNPNWKHPPVTAAQLEKWKGTRAFFNWLFGIHPNHPNARSLVQFLRKNVSDHVLYSCGIHLSAEAWKQFDTEDIARMERRIYRFLNPITGCKKRTCQKLLRQINEDQRSNGRKYNIKRKHEQLLDVQDAFIDGEDGFSDDDLNEDRFGEEEGELQEPAPAPAAHRRILQPVSPLARVSARAQPQQASSTAPNTYGNQRSMAQQGLSHHGPHQPQQGFGSGNTGQGSVNRGRPSPAHSEHDDSGIGLIEKRQPHPGFLGAASSKSNSPPIGSSVTVVFPLGQHKQILYCWDINQFFTLLELNGLCLDRKDQRLVYSNGDVDIELSRDTTPQELREFYEIASRQTIYLFFKGREDDDFDIPGNKPEPKDPFADALAEQSDDDDSPPTARPSHDVSPQPRSSFGEQVSPSPKEKRHRQQSPEQLLQDAASALHQYADDSDNDDDANNFSQDSAATIRGDTDARAEDRQSETPPPRSPSVANQSQQQTPTAIVTTTPASRMSTSVKSNAQIVKPPVILPPRTKKGTPVKPAPIPREPAPAAMTTEKRGRGRPPKNPPTAGNAARSTRRKEREKEKASELE